MKKFTLVLSLLMAVGATSMVKAQSFSFGNVDANVVASDPWLDAEAHVELINTTATLKRVKVERTINYVTPGQLDLFCFGSGVTGLCYPPGTAASNGNDTILGGATDHSFKAALKPMGVYGNASIHYRFYDTSNPADSVGVDINWSITTSIAENTMNYGISKPINNPADGFTAFNYNLQTNEVGDQIVIFNMLGSKVRTIDVPGKQGTLVITTSDLKSGMYMVSYLSGGKVKDTSRLVVSHR